MYSLTHRPVSQVNSNVESDSLSCITGQEQFSLAHLPVSQEVKSNIQSGSPLCIASQEQFSLTHLPVSQEVKSNLHVLQHVKPQAASLPRLKQYKH